MESTREIAKRTYDEQTKNGMIPHPISWHLWKKAFDIAEIEFNKREAGKKEIETTQTHLPLGGVSGCLNMEYWNKDEQSINLKHGSSRILSIEKYKNGFKFSEECDKYFWHIYKKEEALKLVNELYCWINSR